MESGATATAAEAQPLNHDAARGSDKAAEAGIQAESAPVVVVTRPEDPIYTLVTKTPAPVEKPKVCPAIGFSCFVFWCCPGCLLPFVAFVFAAVAALVKDNRTASRIVLASLCLSVLGVACGAIGWAALAISYIGERDKELNRNN